MTGSIYGYTPNYNFPLPTFAIDGWHTYYYQVMYSLDALLAKFIGGSNMKGPWEVATLYEVDDVVVDIASGILYYCLVEHTSASTGTFSDDRTAHPTYWFADAIAVSSVFGRSGVIVATAGDYTAAQVTFTPYETITSVTVQTAIAELKDEIDAIPATTLLVANNLSDLADAATARDNIGVGDIIVDSVGNGLQINTKVINLKLADSSLFVDASGLKVAAQTYQVVTGMMFPYLGTTAPTGWVLVDDGTIGDAVSGATNRAANDTEDLFTLLWESYSDSICAVSTGRGANASADFAAHKTITLPAMCSRTIGVTGSGSGLTTRTAGAKVGEELHTMTTDELVEHSHVLPFGNDGTGNQSSGNGRLETTNSTSEIGRRSVVDTEYDFTGIKTTGSSTPFNVMQPTTFLNWIIKL